MSVHNTFDAKTYVSKEMLTISRYNMPSALCTKYLSEEHLGNTKKNAYKASKACNAGL